MWLAKITLKHDCIIGKRCLQFSCTSVGYPLDFYEENKYNYFFHFEKLSGEQKNIDQFIADLKKDKRIQNLEAENNTLFFTYKTKAKGEMPTQSYLKKVFHLKPVFVDAHGIEHWEVGSWKKESLMDFIEQIKKQTEGLEQFKLEKIVKTKLRDIYFPHIMPLMTSLQEKALQLAQKEGYYEFPRKIELRQLAKIIGVSLSTYREHLRKAEKVALKNF
ncbi:helix-turn-helix domain-containing protein [Candidatus Woesearchaeota archaeon]|nr:helix-turn-helix domain-containing protein [Candidatus Woesearchaeota archaeon]